MVIEGEIKGRLVSAETISASSYLTGSVAASTFCLPISLSQNIPATDYVSSFIPTVSPYFSLDFLINSQPTRAPAMKV